MAFEIKGKIALVTGGANGIGLAYVRELLRHGAKKVAIADIDKNGHKVAQELNGQHGNDTVIFIEANVINKEELAAVFEKTFLTFKGLDVLINNAGILNDANWEKQIALNCNAVVEGSLLGIKYMGKNNEGKGGVIVNIASILGLQKLEGCPVYTASKHFVVGLTRSFGSPYYLDLTGIKFVTMCPGVTDTPLIFEANKMALKGFPDLGTVLAAGLGSLPNQPTSNVAEGMMTLITKGSNGSVWVSEGSEAIYEVEIPDRLTLRKK